MTTGHTDDENLDGALVRRARDGDADAFAALYDDLAPRLLGFLCHQLGDADLAEELMQKTFVKVMEALPRYKFLSGVPFRAWVFRIARNVVIDAHRTAHPALPLSAVWNVPGSGPGPEQILVARAEREELYDAIDHLPRDEHDVIAYRFFAGLAPREAGQLLHRSAGAVRVLQHRALRRLRTMLAPVADQGATAGAGS